MAHSLGVELADGLIEVIDLKNEVAQSAGLGAGEACGRVGEREELDGVFSVERKVGLVGSAFGAIMLGNDGEAEDAGVEIEAAPIVGADCSLLSRYVSW